MNLRLLLLPFSIIYAGIMQLRNLFFDKGWIRQKRYNVPVLLVGNLSVGGTGKTPHVEYLLTLLQSKYRMATLSRGYGRKTHGFLVAGKGASAQSIGDEPMQYYTKFRNVTVAVCEKRTEGIDRLLALQNKPQVIIMDDGFQHRQVDPGYKILLTGFNNLYTKDYVLPAGDLRELSSGYRRADCIVVTGCNEKLNTAEKNNIINELQPLSHQEVFFSSLIYGNPMSFFSEEHILLTELNKRPVVLFTGIANATPLEKFLHSKTATLKIIRFPDHHEYTKNDIALLTKNFNKFADLFPVVITTEKDFQRLRNTGFIKDLECVPCYYIPIIIQIDKQELFNTLIKNYVEKNTGNS